MRFLARKSRLSPPPHPGSKRPGGAAKAAPGWLEAAFVLHFERALGHRDRRRAESGGRLDHFQEQMVDRPL